MRPTRRWGICLAVALVLPATLTAARKPKPRKDLVVAERCLDVVAQGDRVYLGQTSGLGVVDVSDPLHPQEIGRHNVPGEVLGVTVVGDLAYLATGTRGLVILDLTDPAKPREVLRENTAGKLRRVAVRGNHVLLAEGIQGLRVLDVTDPARPLPAATISTRDDLRDLALLGPLLATAEGRAGVRLFDVERPETPRELAALGEMQARGVALLSGVLLVAADDRGLLVYGLDKPQRPQLLAELPGNGPARDVAAAGQLAVVSHGGSALQIVSLADPARPWEITEVRPHRSVPAGRVSLDGTRLFVALDVAGLGLIDLSRPEEPQVLLPRRREFKIEFTTVDELAADE